MRQAAPKPCQQCGNDYTVLARYAHEDNGLCESCDTQRLKDEAAKLKEAS